MLFTKTEYPRTPNAFSASAPTLLGVTFRPREMVIGAVLAGGATSVSLGLIAGPVGAIVGGVLGLIAGGVAGAVLADFTEQTDRNSSAHTTGSVRVPYDPDLMSDQDQDGVHEPTEIPMNQVARESWNRLDESVKEQLRDEIVEPTDSSLPRLEKEHKPS